MGGAAKRVSDVRVAVFCTILVIACCVRSFAESLQPATCATFAADGTLATGTLRNGELQLSVDGRTTTMARVRLRPEGNASCEVALNDDGRWLAAVVPADRLVVWVLDRKSQTLRRQFSSEWQELRNLELEPYHSSSFLGGFQTNDSLALWRCIPDTSVRSQVDLHLQRWSLDGELLSDQNLGNDGGERTPTPDPNGLVWISVACDTSARRCYRSVRIDGGVVTPAARLSLPENAISTFVPLPDGKRFVTVTGLESAQKAVLVDSSGRVEDRAALPFFPNLLRPLIPDWFQVNSIAVSHDGNFVAISRSHIAWVLVDGDRDWGSEILLLSLHPLAIVKTVKTGNGGTGAIAVDHRGNQIRLVGFWKNGWHEMRYEERRPGKWVKAAK